MAEITLTVKQIMDLGLWEKVCDYKGWEYCIVNEGLIQEYELITFDSEFKEMDSMSKLKPLYIKFKSLEDEYIAMERDFKNSIIGKTVSYDGKSWVINCFSAGVLELKDENGESLCEHIDNIFQ